MGAAAETPAPKLCDSAQASAFGGGALIEVIGGGAVATNVGDAPAEDAAEDIPAEAEAEDELEWSFVVEREDGAPVNMAYRIDAEGKTLHEGMFDQNGETVAFPMSTSGDLVFWIP
jgi:hypothetical protein